MVYLSWESDQVHVCERLHNVNCTTLSSDYAAAISALHRRSRCLPVNSTLVICSLGRDITYWRHIGIGCFDARTAAIDLAVRSQRSVGIPEKRLQRRGFLRRRLGRRRKVFKIIGAPSNVSTSTAALPFARFASCMTPWVVVDTIPLGDSSAQLEFVHHPVHIVLAFGAMVNHDVRGWPELRGTDGAFQSPDAAVRVGKIVVVGRIAVGSVSARGRRLGPQTEGTIFDR
mmetsp:Transcript_2248/g.3876  ORF Transcript_2248/g.3876 Transcript_2248/m.3876 type:complete len:229 (-) Transcript_2248:358-1044(-)